MASELRVNTLKDASGNNSVAMEYVANGSAKSWVNFNGTVFAARDSLNVSGLVDNGAGDYTITFSNAFDNANYATSYGRSIDSSAYPGGGVVVANYITTSMRLIPQRDTGGVNVDTAITLANYHGDLA